MGLLSLSSTHQSYETHQHIMNQKLPHQKAHKRKKGQKLEEEKNHQNPVLISLWTM